MRIVSAAERLAAELGVRAFGDHRELADSGLVEAVSIATPHHLHASIGMDCLRAGLHVFIEKPLAERISEADALIALARARGLEICVGHQYRVHRSSQLMKRLLDEGAVGRVLRVLWTWNEFRPESYYTRGDLWRATWRHAGGGVLANQASHDLDLMCWMLGRPVQVSALMGNQLHAAEVEDVFCASLRFEGGALGSFQSTINQPRGYSVRQIAGDRGMIVLPDVKSLTGEAEDEVLLGTYAGELSSMLTALPGHADQPDVRWRRIPLPRREPLLRPLMRPKGVWRRVGLYRPEPGALTVLMDSFVGAILDGGKPLVTGESARSAVELINAIVLSATRGKTVNLPLDAAEYDELFEELVTGSVGVQRSR